MKQKVALVLLLGVVIGNGLFAQNFMQTYSYQTLSISTTASTPTLVKVCKLESYLHGMKVKVLEHLTGTTPNEQFIVWGDFEIISDSREPVNELFANNDTLLLNLLPCDLGYNIVKNENLEQVQDYELTYGVFYLKIKNDNVIGDISKYRKTMKYKDFKAYLNTYQCDCEEEDYIRKTHISAGLMVQKTEDYEYGMKVKVLENQAYNTCKKGDQILIGRDALRACLYDTKQFLVGDTLYFHTQPNVYKEMFLYNCGQTWLLVNNGVARGLVDKQVFEVSYKVFLTDYYYAPIRSSIEKTTLNYRIYPTLTQDKFYFQSNTIFDGTLKIYSVNGVLQKEIRIKNTTNESVDISNFNTGIYLIVLYKGEQIVTREKLVKY